MNQAQAGVRKRPSTSTIILGVAGAIAVASAGVALTRDNEEAAAPAGAHGTAKPDQPVGDVNSMIASLEAKLKQKPEDAQGWRMLGWSHFETGDLLRSASAYRRAAQIEPNNAENWSSLGEALQSASTEVSPEAKTAFERAIGIDPKDPRARYFLGVQKDLTGQHAAAVNDWIALLKDTPPGAPWEADLRRTITQVAEKSKIDIKGRIPAPEPSPAGQTIATEAIPGPTREQLAAATSIPPSQQDEMVQGMVSRLANRLKANPKDADGWIRLMRARMVLGEAEAARDALRTGRAAFQGDSSTQARLDRAAQELGVPSGG